MTLLFGALTVTNTLSAVFVTGSPCKKTQKLLPPGKYRPVLTLLPDDGPIFIPYGTPATFNPGHCSLGNATAACAVVAWDVQASSGKRADITKYITVSQTLDCGSNAQVNNAAPSRAIQSYPSLCFISLLIMRGLLIGWRCMPLVRLLQAATAWYDCT